MLRGKKNRKRMDPEEARGAFKDAALRTLKGVATVVALVLICAGSAWSAAKARVWLYTSPTFAIDRFSFEGVRRASEEELTRLSGVSLGENIFQADLIAAEKAMSAHPWVRRLWLEREYPRTVIVRVIEHEPAALADLGGLYYVDEAGRPFKKLGPGEEGDMPILRGVTREEYTGREKEIEALYREALDALAAYRDSGLEKSAPASEVKVDRVEGLTLFCGRDATAVKIGTGTYREKFERLAQLFTELAKKGARAEVVHLDNRTRPGWVAVQLAQGTVESGGQ